MNLLFSIDDNYTTQLETVLLSIRLNTRPAKINVYVIQEQPLQKTAELRRVCQNLKMRWIIE